MYANHHHNSIINIKRIMAYVMVLSPVTTIIAIVEVMH